MSKKNNLETRRNRHKFDLEREKELHAKKQKKIEKKQHKQAVKGSPSKVKSRGIRIRKGVRIKGVKVVDAASKKRARELLAAEQAMRQMDVESPAPSPTLKAKRKGKGKAKAGGAPSSSAGAADAEPMDASMD